MSQEENDKERGCGSGFLRYCFLSRVHLVVCARLNSLWVRLSLTHQVLQDGVRHISHHSILIRAL